METTSLTQRTLDFAVSKGADLAAAVPVDELPEVPGALRPEEFVTGARSVLVIGLKLVDAIWDRLKGKDDFFSDTLHNYLLNYNYPMLDVLAIQTARFLEKEGYDAFPIQGPAKRRVRVAPDDALGRTDRALETMLMKQGRGIYAAPFAFKSAAVAAGFGAVGKNMMVITPEYGPRARLICVITDAPLERTQPAATATPVEVCGDCAICLDACPVGALTFDEATGRSTIDVIKCNAYMDYCQCALCQGICPLGKRRKQRRSLSAAVVGGGEKLSHQ